MLLVWAVTKICPLSKAGTGTSLNGRSVKVKLKNKHVRWEIVRITWPQLERCLCTGVMDDSAKGGRLELILEE